MTVLQQQIESVVAKGESAFIPYIMAGDGGLDDLQRRILFLQEAGATAIELGIPFSDPVADGPVIQQAGIRALSHGTTLQDVLHKVAHLNKDVMIPIIIMTYVNPVLQLGVDEFARLSSLAGVAGVIIPDMPLEESGLLQEALKPVEIDLIQLVSLTSPIERVKRIADASQGFVYAVTVNGITGTRQTLPDITFSHLAQLKAVSPVPVMAGFGVSKPEHVKQLGEVVDGVIVGSFVVDALANGREEEILPLISAAKAAKSRV